MRREENELLARIGPGTPAGELLRRYWHPVAGVAELSPDKPIKPIRILGENLVVYRDKAGRYGIVAEKCPHRGASLAYGRVEQEGIRCPYHGWRFAASGKCLETPAEKQTIDITHTAYPVEELGGMLFVYMGPAPAPALPHWDVMAWEHGERRIERHSVINCNWFQAMENSVDPSHLYWLHGEAGHLRGEYAEQHDFEPFDYGIVKRRTTTGSGGHGIDQHPLLFPNILRHVFKRRTNNKITHNLQYRIPVDDTHTQVFMVTFVADPSQRATADNTPVEFVSMTNDDGSYRMDLVLAQDVMAWETQGAIADRTTEFLGEADRGIVMLRRLMRQQIELVREGKTPLGVKPAGEGERIIELDVINERIGLKRSQTKAA